MRYVAVGFLMFFFMTSLAAAQTGTGYVFIVPGQFRAGGSSSFGIHFDGGGKYVTSSGLGFEAEMGIAGRTEHFADNVAGLFSANGYYHFKTSTKRIYPFATAGYSRTFGHRSGAKWLNLGVGLEYWFKHGGYLVEFRDHIRRESGVTGQFWTIRIGFVFG